MMRVRHGAFSRVVRWWMWSLLLSGVLMGIGVRVMPDMRAEAGGTGLVATEPGPVEPMRERELAELVQMGAAVTLAVDDVRAGAARMISPAISNCEGEPPTIGFEPHAFTIVQSDLSVAGYLCHAGLEPESDSPPRLVPASPGLPRHGESRLAIVAR